jgi:hypothetical protein
MMTHIETLKQIASEYKLTLSEPKHNWVHIQYTETGRTLVPFRPWRLDAMTEKEFTAAILDALTAETERPVIKSDIIVEQILRKQQSRSPITGHFRGGGR